MTIGSLFSGIGGLEIGLERAGLGPVIWQAESDAFCREQLEKHWPHAGRYHDVRFIDEAAPRVALICGGFPCQDVSVAGSGAGIEGPRSGLWSEFARVVGLLRPEHVVVENVPALLGRGFERVLGDLAALGYDAIWDCIPAAAVGAPHRRDRIFVVARRVPDAFGNGVRLGAERGPSPPQPADSGYAEPVHMGETVGHANGARSQGRTQRGECQQKRQPQPRSGRETLAHALGDGPQGEFQAGPAQGPAFESSALANSNGGRREGIGFEGNPGGDREQGQRGNQPDGSDLPLWPPAPDDVYAWEQMPANAQPAICRLADGFAPQLSRRRQKLQAIGNAVVPAVAEVIGRAIMESL